jgi:hypothetical protein
MGKNSFFAWYFPRNVLGDFFLQLGVASYYFGGWGYD